MSGRRHPSRRHHGRAPRRFRGVLHALSTLLTLAAGPERTEPPGARRRRRRQQLSLAKRLLDPLPARLRPDDRSAETFWRALGWGGAGALLAVLLHH